MGFSPFQITACADERPIQPASLNSKRRWLNVIPRGFIYLHQTNNYIKLQVMLCVVNKKLRYFLNFWNVLMKKPFREGRGQHRDQRYDSELRPFSFRNW